MINQLLLYFVQTVVGIGVILWLIIGLLMTLYILRLVLKLLLGDNYFIATEKGDENVNVTPHSRAERNHSNRRSEWWEKWKSHVLAVIVFTISVLYFLLDALNRIPTYYEKWGTLAVYFLTIVFLTPPGRTVSEETLALLRRKQSKFTTGLKH